MWWILVGRLSFLTIDFGEVVLAAALDCVPRLSSAELQSRHEAMAAVMLDVSALPIVSFSFHIPSERLPRQRVMLTRYP